MVKALSKECNCLAGFDWVTELGWYDIHWLARDQRWAVAVIVRPLVGLFEYAVGTYCCLLLGGAAAAPRRPASDGPFVNLVELDLCLRLRSGVVAAGGPMSFIGSKGCPLALG